MLLALIPVMFTYSGWNAATYVAEEVHSPGKNVPLALGLGTLTVIVIYLSLNALFLYALPASELAAVPGARLIDTVAQRLGISVFEAVVVADDCHQAGLVRDDVPKRMRGRRLPRSVTLAASGWALVKKG